MRGGWVISDKKHVISFPGFVQFFSDILAYYYGSRQAGNMPGAKDSEIWQILRFCFCRFFTKTQLHLSFLEKRRPKFVRGSEIVAAPDLRVRLQHPDMLGAVDARAVPGIAVDVADAPDVVHRVARCGHLRMEVRGDE